MVQSNHINASKGCNFRFKINPCHAEQIEMPHPFLLVSQSDYLIQTVDINWDAMPISTCQQSDYLIQTVDIKSHAEWQTVSIQISWLLQKPTDLDLHCLQRLGIPRFSRARVKPSLILDYNWLCHEWLTQFWQWQYIFGWENAYACEPCYTKRWLLGVSRQWRPRPACTSVLFGQGLCCTLTGSLDLLQQRPWKTCDVFSSDCPFLSITSRSLLAAVLWHHRCKYVVLLLLFFVVVVFLQENICSWFF